MRHVLLGPTLPPSLCSTGTAHQLLPPTIPGNIPAASSHQAAASDRRREGTTLGLCRQRSWDKVDGTFHIGRNIPHWKELPRGAHTPKAGCCYVLTHAPKHQMCTFPPHQMNHCIQMWELLPALRYQRQSSKRKAPTVSLTQADPQRHSSLSPVSWGTGMGLQGPKRRPTLVTSNRGWDGGRAGMP